jgi:hypothetical protein
MTTEPTTSPSGWAEDDLRRIGGADELQIASRRPDGNLRSFVTIWVVRIEDEIYVRSAHGPENPWYGRALASGHGRIRAGGVERDVRIVSAADADQAAVDAAYHSKYDRYGARIVNSVVGPTAAGTTLKLIPRH